MRASTGGRDELAGRVQRALSLPTKKEAERVVNAVIGSLETTLLNHLGSDGFTLKLNGFGKFFVRHRPGIVRKLGFSGETIRTKMLWKINGYAHGSELPAGESGLLYSIGFVMATGCLHAAGISIGLVHRWHWGKRALRVVGAAIALAGIFFMWKVFA